MCVSSSRRPRRPDRRRLISVAGAACRKLKALQRDPRVSMTLDDGSTGPDKALLLRGRAEFEQVNGVAAEYERAPQRYFGAEQGAAWVAQVGHLVSGMMRIRAEPEWATNLDFEQRFPSALERAMAAAAR